MQLGATRGSPSTAEAINRVLGEIRVSQRCLDRLQVEIFGCAPEIPPHLGDPKSHRVSPSGHRQRVLSASFATPYRCVVR